MNKIYLLFILITTPLFSNAQTVWTYEVDSQAINGMDIWADENENLYLLGNEYLFNPPYNDSNPFAYEYLQFHFIKIDRNWRIQSNHQFNSTRAVSHFLKNPISKNFILPYVTLNPKFASESCDDVRFENSYYLGLVSISENNSGDLQIDTLRLEYDRQCKFPAIHGAVLENDSLLIVYSDHNLSHGSFETDTLYFQWVDTSGDLLGKFSNFYPLKKFELQGSTYHRNYISLSANSLFLTNENIVNQSIQDRLAVMDFTGQIKSEYLLTHSLNEIKIDSLGNFIFYADHSWRISKVDENFNSLWELFLPGAVEDMEILPDNRLLVLMRGITQSDKFKVGIVSEDGQLMAVKDYAGEENYFGTSIALVNDESFAAIGRHFISPDESSIGNPFAKLIVIKDKLSNLDAISMTDEIQNNIEINVFPNPSSNYWNITIPEQLGDLKIYSIFGKLIWQEENLTQRSIKIDNTKFSKGIFIITWKSKGLKHSSSKKIVKN